MSYPTFKQHEFQCSPVRYVWEEIPIDLRETGNFSNGEIEIYLDVVASCSQHWFIVAFPEGWKQASELGQNAERDLLVVELRTFQPSCSPSFPFSCQFPVLRRTNSPPYGVPCIKYDFNGGFTVLRHFPVGRSNFCRSVNLGGKVYDKSSRRKVSAAWSVTKRWIHLFACLCRSYVPLEIASPV